MARSYRGFDAAGVDAMGPVEFDADRGVFRATCDGDRDSASMAVVAAVAAATAVDPTDLAPLQAAVDTDALGALFPGTADGEGRGGRVSFRYEGHDVTLFGDGTVEVGAAGTP